MDQAVNLSCPVSNMCMIAQYALVRAPYVIENDTKTLIFSAITLNFHSIFDIPTVTNLENLNLNHHVILLSSFLVIIGPKAEVEN